MIETILSIPDSYCMVVVSGVSVARHRYEHSISSSYIRDHRVLSALLLFRPNLRQLIIQYSHCVVYLFLLIKTKLTFEMISL